jgi:hypothetical protein
MNKFPKILYVVIDPDSKDTIADANPEALSYPEDTAPMARYVLAGTGVVSNYTKYVEQLPGAPQHPGQYDNRPMNPYEAKQLEE